MAEVNAELLRELCDRHDIEVLKLFGSAARGQETPESDLDLLVRFRTRKSLLDLVRIERELTEALGRRVDLVTEEALSPHLRDRILDEAVELHARAG